MDKDTDKARLAAHRAMHRMVHPGVADGWRKQRENELHDLIQAVTEALRFVDHINERQTIVVVTEAAADKRFRDHKPPTRKYTLGDARADARNAAASLRRAWDLLDPIKPQQPTTEQLLAALGPCGK